MSVTTASPSAARPSAACCITSRLSCVAASWSSPLPLVRAPDRAPPSAASWLSASPMFSAVSTCSWRRSWWCISRCPSSWPSAKASSSSDCTCCSKPRLTWTVPSERAAAPRCRLPTTSIRGIVAGRPCGQAASRRSRMRSRCRSTSGAGTVPTASSAPPIPVPARLRRPDRLSCAPRASPRDTGLTRSAAALRASSASTKRPARVLCTGCTAEQPASSTTPQSAAARPTAALNIRGGISGLPPIPCRRTANGRGRALASVGRDPRGGARHRWSRRTRRRTGRCR